MGFLRCGRLALAHGIAGALEGAEGLCGRRTFGSVIPGRADEENDLVGMERPEAARKQEGRKEHQGNFGGH